MEASNEPMHNRRFFALSLGAPFGGAPEAEVEVRAMLERPSSSAHDRFAASG
jgi:hypothetical protein